MCSFWLGLKRSKEVIKVMTCIVFITLPYAPYIPYTLSATRQLKARIRHSTCHSYIDIVDNWVVHPTPNIHQTYTKHPANIHLTSAHLSTSRGSINNQRIGDGLSSSTGHLKAQALPFSCLKGRDNRPSDGPKIPPKTIAWPRLTSVLQLTLQQKNAFCPC